MSSWWQHSKPGSLFSQLKWRLTLSYTLVSLAAIFMLAWWGLIAVTVYLDRVNLELTWIEILQEQVLPALQVILPSALLFILPVILPVILPAILISTYFGFLSARWLDIRLANLRQATQAWQQGNFSVVAPVEPADEVGNFGRELNRMAEELERLLETRQELAALHERYRLARDLHDSVKQHLTAAALQLGAAQALLDQDPTAGRACVAEAANLTHTAQQELSAIIVELRPAALDQRGLAEALRSYVDQWSRQTKAGVQMQVQGERKLPAGVEQALFRFAQEALANVARHSAATQVEIYLSFTPAEVTLAIQDNGRGFDLQAAQGRGFGLRNMRERIDQAGGQLSIESRPGQGTQITARAPAGKILKLPGIIE